MKDENKNMIEITGQVKNIIFRNKENGYTVFKIKTMDEKNSSEFVCNGYFADIYQDEILGLSGFFFMHKLYGEQFKVLGTKKKMPVSEEEMQKYLASGIIKGVGPKIAEKIVFMFKEKTFDVIENDCEKLLKIKGINKKLALNINKSFVDLERDRNNMIYLQSLDISQGYINKIKKRYGDNLIELLKINPYRLIDEIVGIGFKKADLIAEKSGIEKNSDFRIKSGIKFCLRQASENNGHVCLPKEILLDNVKNLLEIDLDLIEKKLDEMLKENLLTEKILDGKKVVYLNFFYLMEEFIAKKILSLNEIINDLEIKNLDDEIKKFSFKKNICLTERQMVAVKEAIKNGISIITGGPGTGKTTTLKVILGILKSKGFCVELCAPTGRAAKKMTEATGYQAKTVHRLLGINFFDDGEKKIKFDFDENHLLETDYLIIDESSMIDIYLIFNLLKAIKIGTKLIFVGDVDQLSSVGPGNILKDLIESKKIKVVYLEKIFRQAEESLIVINAHKINKSERLELNKSNCKHDFFLINNINSGEIINIIIKMILERIPKKLGLKNILETQVLCPMKRGDLGTVNLNKILQEKLNVADYLKNETVFNNNIFREGDKIMQIKNNYSLEWRIFDKKNICVANGFGIFNGDTGFIKKIDHEQKKIIIKFDDDKVVGYSFLQLDEIDLAYAITIHKSQGSEYKSVIIPVLNGPPMLMNKNLLYTAVTRAKDLAILIGNPKIIYAMIKNKKELERYSGLKFKIKSLCE